MSCNLKRTEKLEIDRVAAIGRTFGEYAAFFALDEATLSRGPILDCAAGVSSFAAEAAVDHAVTACDPLYGLPATELAAKGSADLAHVFDRFEPVAHQYTWSHYRDREEVVACRRLALSRFLEDFPRESARGRYLPAALPRLPFGGASFGLVLCSHFLFLYHDRLDREFHRAALMELVRVSSGEVRIFPLQGLDAKPYPELAETLAWLAGRGIGAEIREVPFEFQKGSNKMLCLRRKL